MHFSRYNLFCTEDFFYKIILKLCYRNAKNKKNVVIEISVRFSACHFKGFRYANLQNLCDTNLTIVFYLIFLYLMVCVALHSVTEGILRVFSISIHF